MAHEFDEGPDGLYSICLFNCENCPDDELYEVFGKFGDIVRINRSNNIIFLRYQTLEEAVNCYKSLKNHPKYKVKPGKKKGGSSNTGRSMAHEFDEGPDGLYSICVFNGENCPDDELYEVFGKFGVIKRIKRSNNIIFLHYQTLEEAVNCYKSLKNHPKYKVKPGKKKGGSSNTGRFRESKGGEMNRNENVRGWRPEASGGGDFGRPSGAGGNRRGPPKLIPFPSPVAEEAGATKPPPKAKLVVIGNLNPKMSQCHVYTMCTTAKAPPIHVEMKQLKRPPYPTVLYAYVYVRTDEEVQNIVEAYNNLTLNEHTLVAAAFDELKEEGKVLLQAK